MLQDIAQMLTRDEEDEYVCADAYFTCGLALAYIGNSKDAVEQLNQAMNMYPEDASQIKEEILQVIASLPEESTAALEAPKDSEGNLGGSGEEGKGGANEEGEEGAPDAEHSAAAPEAAAAKVVDE